MNQLSTLLPNWSINFNRTSLLHLFKQLSLCSFHKMSMLYSDGFQYLHSHMPCMIRRDLNCSNILMNGNIGFLWNVSWLHTTPKPLLVVHCTEFFSLFIYSQPLFILSHLVFTQPMHIFTLSSHIFISCGIHPLSAADSTFHNCFC